VISLSETERSEAQKFVRLGDENASSAVVEGPRKDDCQCNNHQKKKKYTLALQQVRQREA
jgi:hypothetical protein